MKVKATTPEMVVVDPETHCDPDEPDVIFFDGKYLRIARIEMVRMYKDRFEIDIKQIDQLATQVKKTFKMHFDDLIQMDATMHQICTSFKGGKKAEKETTNHP